MLAQEFISYLKNEKRYSPHTITAYSRDIAEYQEFMALSDFPDLSFSEPGHIKKFIIHLMESGGDPASVNRKLSALRSAFKYGMRRGLISVDPSKALRAPKAAKKLPVFIEDHKIMGLLDHAEIFTGDFNGQRDKLIIEMLFGTGMRLAELLNLKLADIDKFTGTIRVQGKRNKERIIPVPVPVFVVIDNYRTLRTLHNLDNISDNLVVTNTGRRAYAGLIYRVVQKYLKLISTQDKRSPHVLRHSYATSLLNNGGDLNSIKELLGHSSLAATQVYVHNSIERIKSVYKQAHPKA